LKSLSYKQWKEALGGVGEPSQPPINPNEPSRNPNAMFTNRPLDIRAKMQKLKINKPMQ
jgi:hypothetical protein